MKKWLRGQPEQPSTIDDLQALVDAFVEEYNDHRATPVPGAPRHPGHGLHHPTQGRPATGDREADTHDRIREGKVDKSGKVTLRYQGRLHSIGIGRTHARARVLLLVQDRDIRIIDAATGELLRELILDPAKRSSRSRAPTHPTKNEGRPTRASACFVERDLCLDEEALQRDLPRRQISRERQPGEPAVDLVVLMDDEVAVRDRECPLDPVRRQDLVPGQPVGCFTELHHE